MYKPFSHRAVRQTARTIASLGTVLLFGIGRGPSAVQAQSQSPHIVEVDTASLPEVSVRELDRTIRTLFDGWCESGNSLLASETLPFVVPLEPWQPSLKATTGRITAAWMNGAPIDPRSAEPALMPQLGTNTLRVHLEGVAPMPAEIGRTMFGVDPASAALFAPLLKIATETLRDHPNSRELALLPTGLDINPTATGLQRRMRLTLAVTHDGIPFLDEAVRVEALSTADPGILRVVAELSSRDRLPERIDVRLGISAAQAHAAIEKKFSAAPAHVDEPHLFLVGNNPVRAVYRAFVRGPLSATTATDPLAAAFTTHAAFVDASSGAVIAIEDLQQSVTVPVVDGNLHDMDAALQLKTVATLWSGSNYHYALGPYAHVRNDALAIMAPGFAPFVYADGVDLQTFDSDIPLIAPDIEALPIWLMSPGWPGSNSLADDQLDIWTAYYHTDRAASVIQQSTGFLHNFAAPAPGLPASALHIGVNLKPYSVFTTGTWDANLELANGFVIGAYAVPNLFQYGPATVVARAGTFFSRGVTYAETTYNAAPVPTPHVRSDATRDRGIIYHEFTHTVLFGQGLGSWNLSQEVRSMHEGIADYGARVLQNGEDLLFDKAFFSPFPQGLNPGVERYCGTAAPGAPGFVAVDADQPTSVNATPVDAYTTGSAICQALASAEEELVHVDNQAADRVLDLVINSVPSWMPAGTVSSMIDHIRLDEATGYANQLWPNPHQFAYLTHLGIHGLVSNAQNPGREAIMTFPDGAWGQASYHQLPNIPYLVAGGMNDRFTITFSYAAGGSPCWVENGALPPSLPDLVSHSVGGAIPIPTFLSSCGNPIPRLHIDLFTCTGTTDCRQPGAPNVVQMSQRPFAAPLYVDF